MLKSLLTKKSYVIPKCFVVAFKLVIVGCSVQNRRRRAASRAAEGFKLLLVLGMIVCKPFFKHFLARLVLLCLLVHSVGGGPSFI